jgi:hypothetical protein
LFRNANLILTTATNAAVITYYKLFTRLRLNGIITATTIASRMTLWLNGIDQRTDENSWRG